MFNSTPEYYQAVSTNLERQARAARLVASAEQVMREQKETRPARRPRRLPFADWSRRLMHAPSAGRA